jgi:mRNA interferase RelE/StbE
MKLFLSTKAAMQLKNVPRGMMHVLIAKIHTLSRVPFPVGCKKLVHRPGWRIRVGDYRILYVVDNKAKELTILSVMHRKDVYRA